jgi:hypothetical protein
MKVTNTPLQVYTIDRPNSPVNQPQQSPVRVNQFSQARFAELLSMEEKKFITQNFKAESPSRSNEPQLGRFLDIKA